MTENPHIPSEVVAHQAPLPPNPAATPTPPVFDRSSSAFLTAVIALVGACAAQVVAITPMLVPGRSPALANYHGLLWAWFGISGLAVCCGLHGSYRALRRGPAGTFSLLAFFVPYSFTVRVDNLSFGWPFQFHAGMVFGHVGVGVNLVGAGLIVWWLRINRPRANKVISEQ